MQRKPAWRGARLLFPALMAAVAGAVSGCWFTSEQPLITESRASQPIDGEIQLVPMKSGGGELVPDPEQKPFRLVPDGWRYLQFDPGSTEPKPVAFMRYKDGPDGPLYLAEIKPPGWSYTYGIATTMKKAGKEYALLLLPTKDQIDAFFAGDGNELADYPFIRQDGENYAVTSVDKLPELLEAVLDMPEDQPMIAAYEIRRGVPGEPPGPTLSSAGAWKLEKLRDAMTDAAVPIARLDAASVDGAPGVLLQLECQDGRPVVYLDWQETLRRLLPEGKLALADVMLRFGEAEPQHFVWSIAGGSQTRNTPSEQAGLVTMAVGLNAIFMPELGSYVVDWSFDDFAGALASTDRLVARAVTHGGDRMTATFDTTGGAAAVAHIRRDCG